MKLAKLSLSLILSFILTSTISAYAYETSGELSHSSIVIDIIQERNQVVVCGDEDYLVSIENEGGIEVGNSLSMERDGQCQVFSTENWNPGNYFIHIYSADQTYSIQLIEIL